MNFPDSAQLPPAGTPVLVAALNWGLGHATRSSPVIHALLARKCPVHLASDGAALAFWKREFPELTCHELPAWNIRYNPGPLLIPSLLTQLPHIFGAISKEHRMVCELVRKHSIGWILSDNRYGVHHPHVPSILMTHQLRLALPNGLRGLEPLGELGMSLLCRPYQQIWIPDHATEPGLTGKLGHPAWPMRFPSLVYLGPQTRLTPQDVPKRWNSMAVISGPEPARSQLEERLLRDLAKIPGTHLVLLGRPDLPEAQEIRGNVTVAPHMNSHDLSQALCASEVVISRGGYSTLMDLAALGCRALIIPTPGQTEQEYLGQNLHAAGMAHCVCQSDLDLVRDLAKAKATSAPATR